mgnify:CR=1 FL=1
MSCSIVILHYGSTQLTEQCLESVVAYSQDSQVILVDNARDWGFTGARPKRFEYIKPVKNLGFAAGCNTGAKQATEDILVFLNNDCRVREDWLLPLRFDLERDDVGAVSPLLVYPDGRIQCWGVSVDFNRPLAAEARNNTHQYGRIDALTAACTAMRRTVFDQVGGFDEGYWNGYEDVDLSLKIRELGLQLVVDPRSEVVHYESQSDPQERFSKVRENVLRLRERWDPAWLTATSPT